MDKSKCKYCEEVISNKTICKICGRELKTVCEECHAEIVHHKIVPIRLFNFISSPNGKFNSAEFDEQVGGQSKVIRAYEDER